MRDCFTEIAFSYRKYNFTTTSQVRFLPIQFANMISLPLLIHFTFQVTFFRILLNHFSINTFLFSSFVMFCWFLTSLYPSTTIYSSFFLIKGFIFVAILSYFMFCLVHDGRVWFGFHVFNYCRLLFCYTPFHTKLIEYSLLIFIFLSFST